MKKAMLVLFLLVGMIFAPGLQRAAAAGPGPDGLPEEFPPMIVNN